jgi:hypothetical protein
MRVIGKKRLFVTAPAAVLLAAGFAHAAEEPGVGLPKVKPPFMAEETMRQEFVLSVDKNVRVRPKTMNDVPSFKSGGKRLSFQHLGLNRPEVFGVYIDAISKKIPALQIRPTVYVPGAKVDRSLKGTISVDEARQVVTFSRDYYVTNDTKAIFTCEVRNAGKGKIKFAWDNGLTAEQAARLPKNSSVGMVFSTQDNLHQTYGVGSNGKELKLVSAAELKAGHKPKDWCRKILLDAEGAAVQFFSTVPKSAISLDLDSSFHVRITEATWYSPIELSKPRVGLSVRATHPLAKNGSLIVDLGETGVQAEDSPPAVANIDFYGRDRMHIPTRPTRNLVPNPSFEQGLRYMRWIFGGGSGGLSPIPSYTMSNDAKFGEKSLKLQRSPRGNYPLMTFPIPVVFGKTYTVSFYGKSLDGDNQSVNFRVFSPLTNYTSKVLGRRGKQPTYRLGKDWQRFSFTFKADTRAVCLTMSSYRDALIDGVQLEEGSRATDFVAPLVEGTLTTSDPDNMIDKDNPVDARFALHGKAGVDGRVRIRVKDFYDTVIFDQTYAFKLDQEGRGAITLPFDREKLGTGVFVVRADYALGGNDDYTDYYRYSKMTFLSNTHPSKNMFNNQFIPRLTRREELARNYMRWGIGSMCGQSTANDMPIKKELGDKYKIDLGFGTLFYMARDDKELRDDCFAVQRQNPWGRTVEPWMTITPERAKWIEDTAYTMVKRFPYLKAWAPMGETECRWKDYTNGDFTEWRKLAQAFAKGAKRANPDVKLLPCQGTSGFLPEMNRGVVEVTGVTQSVKDSIKWDYIATHPYFSTDGVNGRSDLDKNTAFLIDLLEKNGYGDTPILYPEGGNYTSMLIPEWNCNGCQDFYRAGHAGYDSAWGEYRQAYLHARRFIITFKYWPRVQYLNMWTSEPFMDFYLTPLYMCKVVNTLGQLFAKPTYVADIKPQKSIRGYAFTDHEDRGLVAIWATVDGVDSGTERGPEMRVTFKGKLPVFIDLMGNERQVAAEDGAVRIRLTSAPLFVRSEPGKVDDLVAAFQNAQILGAKNVLDVNVLPNVDGAIEAVISNKTDRELAGTVKAANTAKPFKLDKEASVAIPLTTSEPTRFGAMYQWDQPLEVALGAGDQLTRTLDFEYFYAPYTAQPLPLDPDAPQWKSIPAFSIDNWFLNKRRNPNKTIRHGYQNDLSASYQVAWDEASLYLRVEVKDDLHARSDDKDFSAHALYKIDNCVEVYFDTGVNARADGREKGYDRDDYRYDFAPLADDMGRESGRARVYRLREVYHQIAGGIEMPTKQEVMDNFQSGFKRTPDGVAYVFRFDQKYIEPFMLKNGAKSGFALYVHDKEPGDRYATKGLNTSTRPGSHCDYYPKYWPVMILKK